MLSRKGTTTRHSAAPKRLSEFDSLVDRDSPLGTTAADPFEQQQQQSMIDIANIAVDAPDFDFTDESERSNGGLLQDLLFWEDKDENNDKEAKEGGTVLKLSSLATHGMPLAPPREPSLSRSALRRRRPHYQPKNGNSQQLLRYFRRKNKRKAAESAEYKKRAGREEIAAVAEDLRVFTLPLLLIWLSSPLASLIDTCAVGLSASGGSCTSPPSAPP